MDQQFPDSLPSFTRDFLDIKASWLQLFHAQDGYQSSWTFLMKFIQSDRNGEQVRFVEEIFQDVEQIEVNDDIYAIVSTTALGKLTLLFDKILPEALLKEIVNNTKKLTIVATEPGSNGDTICCYATESNSFEMVEFVDEPNITFFVNNPGHHSRASKHGYLEDVIKNSTNPNISLDANKGDVLKIGDVLKTPMKRIVVHLDNFYLDLAGFLVQMKFPVKEIFFRESRTTYHYWLTSLNLLLERYTKGPLLDVELLDLKMEKVVFNKNFFYFPKILQEIGFIFPNLKQFNFYMNLYINLSKLFKIIPAICLTQKSMRFSQDFFNINCTFHLHILLSEHLLNENFVKDLLSKFTIEKYELKVEKDAIMVYFSRNVSECNLTRKFDFKASFELEDHTKRPVMLTINNDNSYNKKKSSGTISTTSTPEFNRRRHSSESL